MWSNSRMTIIKINILNDFCFAGDISFKQIQKSQTICFCTIIIQLSLSKCTLLKVFRFSIIVKIIFFDEIYPHSKKETRKIYKDLNISFYNNFKPLIHKVRT